MTGHFWRAMSGASHAEVQAGHVTVSSDQVGAIAALCVACESYKGDEQDCAIAHGMICFAGLYGFAAMSLSWKSPKGDVLSVAHALGHPLAVRELEPPPPRLA